MREFWPSEMQLWREMAHFSGRPDLSTDRYRVVCKRLDVGRSSSKRSASHCQYRYPSPRRSGPFGFRPTPLGLSGNGEFCQSCDCCEKTLVLARNCADSGRYKTKQIKGSIPCKLSVFFSPQRPSRRFRHVSITTSSAALLAQPRVQSWPTPSAQTQSPAQSPAVLPALCATKSPTSAAKATQGRSALTSSYCRTPVPSLGVGVFAARPTAPAQTTNDMGGTKPAGALRQVGRAI